MEKKFYFIHKDAKFYDLSTGKFIYDPHKATVSDRKSQMEFIMKEEGLKGCSIICLLAKWNQKKGRYEFD